MLVFFLLNLGQLINMRDKICPTNGGDYINQLEIIKSIAPEIRDIVERRYTILRTIYYNQPIGRRALATELDIGERIARNEVNILKDQGLIEIEAIGMYVTVEGKKILEELSDVYMEFKGILLLQEKLQTILGIQKLIIVPGNSSDNELVLKEMGKITSSIIINMLQSKDIIGITGGSTMAAVASEMCKSEKPHDVMVIPARGGLGSELETQANSIAAVIGNKLGGRYRLLNVPDTLEKDALEIIVKNNEIKESIDLIKNINILIFGIGRADAMAIRRKLPKERINSLMEAGSVAEAFGHYFDIDGNEIWEYKTIGMTLDMYKQIRNLIGVAGGAQKAEAIIAITSLRRDITIVTDESAARRMLEIV